MRLTISPQVRYTYTCTVRVYCAHLSDSDLQIGPTNTKSPIYRPTYDTCIRKIWRVLNVITGRASDKTSCIDAFMVNSNPITDKTQIAN